MSTEQKQEQPEQKQYQDRSAYALLGAGIIFIVVVGIAFASYFYGKQEAVRSEASGTSPAIDITTVVPQQVLGANVFSWEGTVDTINLDTLAFQTDTESDSPYTVSIGPGTKLYQLDLRTPPPPDQPRTNKREIGMDSFRRGDQVLINTSEQIKPNEIVPADSITLLVTP